MMFDAKKKFVPLEILKAERKKHREQIAASQEQLTSMQEQIKKSGLPNEPSISDDIDAIHKQDEIQADMDEYGVDDVKTASVLPAEGRYETITKQTEAEVMDDLSEYATPSIDAPASGGENDELDGAPKLTEEQVRCDHAFVLFQLL